MTETNPQKLTVLLNEIDDILSQTLVELGAMLKDVEQLVARRKELSRIH